jgi:hypothetical protein
VVPLLKLVITTGDFILKNPCSATKTGVSIKGLYERHMESRVKLQNSQLARPGQGRQWFSRGDKVWWLGEASNLIVYYVLFTSDKLQQSNPEILLPLERGKWEE